jgi:hypothetical protein
MLHLLGPLKRLEVRELVPGLNCASTQHAKLNPFGPYMIIIACHDEWSLSADKNFKIRRYNTASCVMLHLLSLLKRFEGQELVAGRIFVSTKRAKLIPHAPCMIYLLHKMSFEANISFKVWRYSTTRCVMLHLLGLSKRLEGQELMLDSAQYPSTAACKNKTTCAIHDNNYIN